MVRHVVATGRYAVATGRHGVATGRHVIATVRYVVVTVLAIAALAGCSGGTPILANPPAPRPSIPLPTAVPSHVADPLPIELPRDDGPHDRLTEWWYYTGHLVTPGVSRAPGHRFGFEFVIFRAERGIFPTSWASHLALTDETGRRFLYAQRLQVGGAVDRSPEGPDGSPTGFDLALTGLDPTDPMTIGRRPWSMSGSDGTDTLSAAVAPDEAATSGVAPFGLDLALTSRKPPALHDGDGWIDFGPAGGSYYYSRTSMAASGTISLDDATVPVEGTAWFDHQWGDFISVGGGGWDWFAVNLDDRRELTLSLVRDADGSYPLVYGTLVDASGGTTHLAPDAFDVTVTRRWTSPTTGADYPAGWSITIPSQALTIDLRPTVADQELDTRATTGVVYWEGSQIVRATSHGRRIGGEAYVELTGYAPSGRAPVPAPAPASAPAPAAVLAPVSAPAATASDGGTGRPN
jgi:predicted secreted hydrolase